MSEQNQNELIEMLNNLPENRPLYKDSGLWQIRTDDMEDVLYEQGANESFFDFIQRAFDDDNNYLHTDFLWSAIN